MVHICLHRISVPLVFFAAAFFNISRSSCKRRFSALSFWFSSRAFAADALAPDQHIRQVTTDPYHDLHSKWSPDGKRIAFDSRRSGELKIWFIPADGGKAVILETGLSGDHHISWAPDGRRLAFDAAWEGRPNIFTISLK